MTTPDATVSEQSSEETAVELDELVDAVVIVDVTATERPEAIRQMAAAVDWGDSALSLDDILKALEEREATAQTVVASGLAMPHAVIDWAGPYRIVLGRSPAGVTYGIPGGPPVYLILLLVVGKPYRSAHLELLAALAELFGDRAFRDTVLAAPDEPTVRQLLRHEAGLESASGVRAPGGGSLNRTVIRQAIDLLQALSAQALLLAVDRVASIPWDCLAGWQGRLLIVTADPNDRLPQERPHTCLLDIPHSRLARMDRANLGLLMAASAGQLQEPSRVVCVTGTEGAQLDSITVAKPEYRFHKLFPELGGSRTREVQPAVLLRVISLAIELANEGREGRSVGTMFVVGDSRRVLQDTQQLVLNPFHGFSRTLRNVLDPSLTETIKEFAQIDGAFVIHRDGTVLSAGTYLAPQTSEISLPSGLGARHTAAAGITAHTRATALTVSQSTGTVTLFHRGAIVLTLDRATRTRW